MEERDRRGKKRSLEITKKELKEVIKIELSQMASVATYPTTSVRAKRKSVSFKKKTRGRRHQRLFEENIIKTKKRPANFENKGSGVVYA